MVNDNGKCFAKKEILVVFQAMKKHQRKHEKEVSTMNQWPQ